HVGEHDIGVVGTAPARQRVLDRIHDEARRLREGDAERGAQRVPEGHLVAQPAGMPIRDPNPRPAARAAQIAEGDHADSAAADVVIGGLTRFVADLGGGGVVRRYDAKPYDGSDGGAKHTYNVAS